MSSEKVYLTKEEQYFLMDMLEVETAEAAVEKFAVILKEEGADPVKMRDYVRKILEKGK